LRILVIEDNIEVVRQLRTVLEHALYVVDVAYDGEEGFFLGQSEPYDCIVLDLGLPKLEGLKVLQQWRSAQIQTPVLILTSRNTWREKVTGLRAGADDYLAKPFELDELMARVEALIRRTSGHLNPIVTCGRVALDTSSARVTLDGKQVELTALEYRTVSYMMLNAGKVISKTELTEHIYDRDFNRDSNVIEVLINRLRHKLHADLICTRRGLGYELN
jgi:two-component system OmpR family response regulator